MTRRELAVWLCANIHKRRMERIGEPPSTDASYFDHMPSSEQDNWLDMADAVLELEGSNHPIERLAELGHDWGHYTMTIADPAWRDEMRHAVVIEMRAEVEKLWEACQGG